MSNITILEKAIDFIKSKEPHYYSFYELFYGWAKYEWEVPIDNLNMDHGMEHSARMLKIVDNIFKDYSLEEFIDTLSPKYVTLLLVSIYTHDIGMQEYFYLRLRYLRHKHPHFIEVSDNNIIRMVHSDIVYEAYNSLSKNIQTIKYLDNTLSQIKQYDEDKHITLYNMVGNLGVELAILTSFHNKHSSCTETRKTINRAIENKKIDIEEHEINQLMSCIGILQLADAFDMTRSRILNSDNISKALGFDLSNSNPADQPIDIITKKLHCYLIDKVDIASYGSEIVANILCSYSSKKFKEHSEVLDYLIKRSLSRLTKKDDADAINMVKMCFSRLKFSVKIPDMLKSPSKEAIPDHIYPMVQTYIKTDGDYNKIIYSELKNVFGSEIPAYLKLYNSQLSMYIGGISVNFTNNKNIIEAMSFRPDDLPYSGIGEIKGEDIYYVLNTRELYLSTPKRKKVKFKDYISSLKDVKSVVYVILRDQGKPIGIVNWNYKETYSQEEIIKRAQKIKNELKHIQHEILQSHRRAMVKIKNLITETYSDYEENVCNYMSDLPATFDRTESKKLFPCRISDIANKISRYLRESSIDCYNKISDENPYLVFGEEYVIASIIQKIAIGISKITDVDLMFELSKWHTYFVVKFVVKGWNSFQGGSISDSIFNILNTNWIIPEIKYEREYGYAMMAKILSYYLGGRISTYVTNDMKVLEIHFCLPIISSSKNS